MIPALVTRVWSKYSTIFYVVETVAREETLVDSVLEYEDGPEDLNDEPAIDLVDIFPFSIFRIYRTWNFRKYHNNFHPELFFNL